MSRQSCRRNLNRLRLHRSYTTTELADVLKVHRRTVQEWRKVGMLPIDENERPLLFLGKTAREFLRARLVARKCKLRPNEIYCLHCGRGVAPEAASVEVEVTDRRISQAVQAVVIRGRCTICQAKIVRFSSTNAVYQTPFWMRMRRPDKRLIGTSSPSLNTDSKQGC
jgi:hypothetical protein